MTKKISLRNTNLIHIAFNKGAMPVRLLRCCAATCAAPSFAIRMVPVLIACLAFMAAPASTLGAIRNGGFENGAGPWKQWPRKPHFYFLKKGQGIGGSTAAYIQRPGGKRSRILYGYSHVKGGQIYALSYEYAFALNRQK